MKIDNKTYELICDALDVFKNISENNNYLTSGSWEEAVDFIRGLNSYLLSTKDRELINKLRLFSSVFPGRPLDKSEFSFSKYIKNKDLEDNNQDVKVETILNDHRNSDKEFYKVFDVHLRHMLPSFYEFTVPDVLGEKGYQKDGLIFNWHVYCGLERMAILHESGCFNYLLTRQKKRLDGDNINVLEIGAGYGFLAHLLMQGLNIRKYLIIDIPESLLFSSLYLIAAQRKKKVIVVSEISKHTFDQDGIYVIPHFFAGKISEYFPEIDLVLNTLSFHEMGSSDVINYADQLKILFSKQVDPGIIFEQNFDNSTEISGCNAKKILRERFVSDVIKTYTPQTRGYAELHALKINTINEIKRCKPQIGLYNKLKWEFFFIKRKISKLRKIPLGIGEAYPLTHLRLFLRPQGNAFLIKYFLIFTLICLFLLYLS